MQEERLSERVLMRFRRLGWLSVVALAMCAQRASAFLDPPYITPEHPMSGQQISVNIYGGVCDAIVGLPGYPQITAQENNIHILFFSVHYDDPEFCNLGTGTATIPLGSYSAGSYTLIVERRYMTVSGPWVQETLGVIPFTVSAAPSQPPIEAPTLSIVGLGVLGLALLVGMLRDLRRRLA
jgi:hypothetical protein